MASLPFSSLCLSTNPFPRIFGSGAPSRFNQLTSFRSPVSKRFRSSVCRAASLAFRDLDADDFRHPLDKQNTMILRAIPGLSELGKVLLGKRTEELSE